jgi:nitroimidazol reductase NimA-like FMN-containing flavoprotein (pyridoxamine 5'-phosphate oxidase superfamily)
MQNEVRRKDKLMPEAQIDEILRTAYCARMATAGKDGWPYICPLLYVWDGQKLWFHNSGAEGHLKANVRHDSKACFEIDIPGQVFAYGRFECDTSVEYQSVIAFGRISIEEGTTTKTRFFDNLMAKYYPEDASRKKHFYPRLDQITLYAMTIERITGKHTPLPAPEDRWPAADHTKSPHSA